MGPKDDIKQEENEHSEHENDESIDINESDDNANNERKNHGMPVKRPQYRVPGLNDFQNRKKSPPPREKQPTGRLSIIKEPEFVTMSYHNFFFCFVFYVLVLRNSIQKNQTFFFSQIRNFYV